MLPQDIRKILDDHTTAGALSLPASAFGSGGLQTVLQTYLPSNAALQLQSVQTTTGTDSVTVYGLGDVLPFAGMDVQAVFSPGNSDGVTLALTATPAAGWTLPASFELLQGSFLDDLPLSDATLHLSSLTPSAALTLAGTIALGGDYTLIQWLLGDSASLAISSPVTMVGRAPVFAFTVQLPKSLHLDLLGDLTPSFLLRSVAVTWTDQSGAIQFAPQLSFGMASTIPLKNAPVPIFIDLSTPRSLLAFNVDLSAVASLGLADLASYVGGADLAGYLPSTNGFPGVSTVAALDFSINPSQRKILSIGVSASVAGDWPLIKGVALTGAGVDFAVLDPLGAKEIEVGINGTVSWPGGSLAMGAKLEKGSSGVTADLFAALREGSVIHLADIIGYFMNVDIDAQLDLTLFDFALSVPSLDWSLDTSLTGDWSLPIGFTSIVLTGASADLQRSAGTTTGTISARATVSDIQFSSTWDLGKQFTLTGKFPDIDLNSLGQKLTGVSLPSSLPAIRITDGNVELTIASASRSPVTRAAQRLRDEAGGHMYDLVLSASATANGSTLGSAIFEVRRTATTNGFLVGFAVPAAWSPGDLFPPLASLFDGLTFSNTGVIVSTIDAQNVALPNLTMPVPSTISPGFTAFTTLALKGDGLDELAKILGTDLALNLVAVIDSVTPANSIIKASLPALAVNHDATFKELSVDLKPAVEQFDLTATISLSVGNEKLDITGKGTIVAKPPASVSIELSVANWHEPFGISGLTVVDAGVKIASSSAGVTIGMLGNFLIGTAPRQFQFLIGVELIDFKVPGALLFELQPTSGTLKLTDLIEQFTSLDLSRVPVLNAIAFKTLDFFVVDDPNGFTIGDQTFQPGIRVKADVLFYDWELTVDIAVNQSRGVYARGNLNAPINLGDGLLVISDFGGSKGPSFLIDTEAFTSGVALVDRDVRRLRSLSGYPLGDAHPARRPLLAGEAATYLELSGKVQLLNGALQQGISLTVSRDTLDFQYTFSFLGISQQLACQLSAQSLSLAAQAQFGFSLEIDLPSLQIGGVTVIPAIHIPGVSAALTLGAALQLKPVSGSFSIGLSFSLAGQSFSPSFSISLGDIGDAINGLWSAISTWLKNNVKALFGVILGTLEDFVNAIASGLISFGNDMVAAANALKAAFNATIEQVAAAFKELGYAFDAACQAIATAFNTTVNAVVAIAKDVWIEAKDDCSMVGADGLMSSSTEAEVPPQRVRGEHDARHVPWNKALFDLASVPAAQPLLYHYYLHKEEVARLIHGDPLVRSNLRRHAAAPGFDPVSRPIGALSSSLACIRPHASPGLVESIDFVRAFLRPHESSSYRAFVQTIRRAA